MPVKFDDLFVLINFLLKIKIVSLCVFILVSMLILNLLAFILLVIHDLFQLLFDFQGEVVSDNFSLGIGIVLLFVHSYQLCFSKIVQLVLLIWNAR